MSFLTLVPAHHVLTQPTSPRDCHRDVMSLFGDIDSATPRKAAQILFRQEHDPSNSLLIRSTEPPVRSREGMRTIEEGSAPAAGTTVGFRLTLNAIHRSRTTGPNPKNTTTPVRPDDFEHDLADTLSGFVAQKLAGALGNVEIHSHDRRLQGRYRPNKASITIQHDLVNGFAIVEDSEALSNLLASGVGRAKAYGCGLLTVRALGGPHA